MLISMEVVLVSGPVILRSLPKGKRFSCTEITTALIGNCKGLIGMREHIKEPEVLYVYNSHCECNRARIMRALLPFSAI